MIQIVDTTLRDGEQTPGVLFSPVEKLHIAKSLEEAGVQYIEAGIPAMGALERETLRQMILLCEKAVIVPWNRAVISDIDYSLEIGAQFIHISLPVSDLMLERKLRISRNEVIRRLRIATAYLRHEGVRFSVGAEDSTRADLDFLLDFAREAELEGAERVRLCDTVGLYDPFSMKALVQPIVRALKIGVEVHAHNDLGMATANALGAIKAGATFVNTTVAGLGERAGNTPLEEIVMALQLSQGIDCGVKTTCLRQLAELVSHAAERPIPAGKSVVGHGVFTHESGIHVDGMIKDPKTYEPFTPELVGAERHFIIGKHSGKSAILYRLKELGIDVPARYCERLIREVRRRAFQQKGGLPDEELRFLSGGFLLRS